MSSPLSKDLRGKHSVSVPLPPFIQILRGPFEVSPADRAAVPNDAH